MGGGESIKQSVKRRELEEVVDLSQRMADNSVTEGESEWNGGLRNERGGKRFTEERKRILETKKYRRERRRDNFVRVF